LGPSPDPTSPIMVDHAMHLIQSFKEITGRDLIATTYKFDNEIGKQLFASNR
jgi:hypothetical protein